MKYLNIKRLEKTLLITIDRQEKLNALNSGVLDELLNTLNICRDDKKIGCVVIAGAGKKSFVAGADIKEMSKFNVSDAAIYSEKGINLFNNIESFTKPVIAAIDGYTLGGGLELALACHIRYSSENSLFGLPEVSLGLIPGYGGTQRLRNIVGLGNACEIIFSANYIKADRALSIGLVNKISASVVEDSVELSNKISKNSPLAIKYAIQSMVSGMNTTYFDSFNIENNLFSSLFDSEDAKEGIDAFINKRSPVFRDK